MPVNLNVLLQASLIILIIAIVVAVVQMILILVDVRQVTKKTRQMISAINVVEWFFGDREIKETLSKSMGSLAKFLRRFLGGEKHHHG